MTRKRTSDDPEIGRPTIDAAGETVKLQVLLPTRAIAALRQMADRMSERRFGQTVTIASVVREIVLNHLEAENVTR